ncbi:hypothetical protein [Bradyrhizobium sp. USDA 4353]
MTKDSTADWRDELWARHAALFAPAAPFATGMGTLPPGWRETVETLCNRLADAAAGEPGGEIKITRLETVNAALEIDFQAISPREAFAVEVDGIAARSSARTACTCQVCGRAGRRYHAGFLKLAVCPIHTPRAAQAIEPNWPTVRIRRDFVEGRSQIVRCEVYDRTLDSFVETSAAALGLKDFP